MATKQLSFYTEGVSFTNLLTDYIKSGLFYNAFEILKEGGFDEMNIIRFVMGQVSFEGDTREGDLSVNINTEISDTSTLVTGWCTLVNALHIKLGEGEKVYNNYEIDKICEVFGDNKHLKALLGVFSPDSLKTYIAYGLLNRVGYVTYEDVSDKEELNGVITQDGVFVGCGFQQHMYLYPILRKLGLSDSGDWLDSERLIHITSGQVTGKVAHNVKYYYRELRNETSLPTDKQLLSMFKWTKWAPIFYGGFKSEPVADFIRQYVVELTDKGAKYGNLVFLRDFCEVNIPKISLEPLDGKYCIRTSPNKSIAGLLNSKFDITDSSEAEIWVDWEKYKDVIKDNELSLFYQEYLDGDNGVCHYKEDGTFSYSLSNKRGEIVQGVKGTVKLSNELNLELENTAKRLYDQLKQELQLEFVVSDGQLYVVQLRIINFPKGKLNKEQFDDESIAHGKSFTMGDVTCGIDEVLIVDEDCDSERLLGKKALIVNNDVEFSHVLALSKSLGIPSLYGIVSPPTTYPKFININTENGVGIIKEVIIK